MYFQVPQFIDIEDKIFGPLTFKQFIYVLGGGGAVFVLVKLCGFIIGIILGAPIAAFAFALAFYKVNNRPFIDIVQAWLSYKIGTKLYTWKHREISQKDFDKKQAKDKAALGSDEESGQDFSYVPQIGVSKLKDITWGLDVLDASQKTTDKEQ